MARIPLIAGNWKMNGSLAASEELVTALRDGVGETSRAEMLVCPPFTYLDRTAQWLNGSRIGLGAQNICAQQGSGAYTGEVSGAMLVDVGCRYAIVGHSERRTLYGETDAVVTEKFRAARAVGIVPILCVGESLEEREKGATEAVVTRQIEALAKVLGIASLAGAVVAYEPIWAIGTGRTATPSQAQEVHALVRRLIAEQDATIASELRILYGGSVKGANAAELFAEKDIDGGLVGGASLNPEDFLAIFRAAAH